MTETNHKEITPEAYFIKYAYPCSHILCTVRGEVTQEQFKQMEDAAINNKTMDRAFLEKAFFRAFARIELVAKDMGKDKWDTQVIKEYFTVRHNPVLDKSDYPETFKDMCRVNIGKVIAFEGDEIIVQYGVDSQRKVKKDYLPDIKIGDKVTIHWQYAIEKL